MFREFSEGGGAGVETPAYRSQVYGTAEAVPFQNSLSIGIFPRM
jgi:hypothetical protein